MLWQTGPAPCPLGSSSAWPLRVCCWQRCAAARWVVGAHWGCRHAGWAGRFPCTALPAWRVPRGCPSRPPLHVSGGGIGGTRPLCLHRCQGHSQLRTLWARMALLGGLAGRRRRYSHRPLPPPLPCCAHLSVPQPRLVLMDESTSALDTRNERLLYQALRSAGGSWQGRQEGAV